MPSASLLICLALVSSVAAEYYFEWLPRPQVDTVPVVAAPQLPEMPHFEIARLETLSETTTRPLFMAGRRPPAPPPPPPVVERPVPAPKPPPAPPPRAPQVGKFLLSAVVITDSGRREAIIRNPKTGKDDRVREGGVIAEWTVREIREDGVTLGWRTQTQDVALRTFAAAPKVPRSTPRNIVRPQTTASQSTKPAQPRATLSANDRKRLQELRARRLQRQAAIRRLQQSRGQE